MSHLGWEEQTKSTKETIRLEKLIPLSSTLGLPLTHVQTTPDTQIDHDDSMISDDNHVDFQTRCHPDAGGFDPIMDSIFCSWNYAQRDFQHFAALWDTPPCFDLKGIELHPFSQIGLEMCPPRFGTPSMTHIYTDGSFYAGGTRPTLAKKRLQRGPLSSFMSLKEHLPLGDFTLVMSFLRKIADGRNKAWGQPVILRPMLRCPL